MSRPPGQEVLVYIPDWLARNLYAEAQSALQAAVENPSREMTISEYITSVLVWRALEKDPKFTEAMERGEADIKAGRVRLWEDVLNEDGA